MPKHAKIVPISAGRPTSQEPHKEMMVPIRNGSCLQLPFSELLPRYLRQQQAHETAQAETTRPKPEHAFCAAHEQICEKWPPDFVPLRLSFALANGAFSTSE